MQLNRLQSEMINEIKITFLYYSNLF